MPHPRISLAVAALLLLIGAFPQPAAAQQNTLPQDPLQLATQVGRYLFAYDQAANRATTMLLSGGADTDGLEANVARQHPDGHWTVGFGQRTEEGGFRLAYEVVMNEERRVDSVRTLEPAQRLAADSYYARAARAQRMASEDVQATNPPYNLLVLPTGSETEYMTVYVIPAQSNPDAYRLGGDYRYEIDLSAGEIVSSTPLHEALYQIGQLPQDAAGSAHRAARPVETDVLFATLRRPQAPHFVLADQQVFRIAPDGAITPMPAGTFEQRDAVEMVTGQ